MIASRLRTLALGVLCAAALGAPSAASAQVALADGSWQMFEWFVDWDGTAAVDGLGFTLTTDHGANVRVVDGFWAGDAFDVYINGVMQHSTPSTAAVFADAADGDAAWADDALSRVNFFLGAGTHTITLAVRDFDPAFLDGQGFIRADFAAGPNPTVTPEPATVLLVGSGLLAVGVASRRRRRADARS